MWLVSESQHETIADSCLSRPGGDGHLVLCKPKMLCYTLRACEHVCRLFLGSSAVEHPTVNRMVAGSNPARGANDFNLLSLIAGPCRDRRALRRIADRLNQISKASFRHGSTK